ncbi:hypothetical protein [Lactiplantibacillus plantarum]|uniref:hypothetical protein n=1 Tax=Lactiplantibacillus plantarum TaxID=1590 RepID=UPI002915C839|nr:hypothetical protein [Lactiplantibacillus plantarum]
MFKQLQATFDKVSAECADLNAKVTAALQDDNFDADAYHKLQDELSTKKTRRDALNDQLQALSAENKQPKNPENNQGQGTPLNPKGGEDNLAKQKSAINMFIHSRGLR